MPLQNLNAHGNLDRVLYGDWETDRYGVLSGIITRRRVEEVWTTPDYSLLVPGAEPPAPVPCTKRRRTYSRGYALYTYAYEGAVDGFDYESRVFCELEGADSQEPIQTHPQFEALFAKYNGQIGRDGTFSHFQRKLKDGKPNPLFGVSHFLALGVIWSRTSIVPGFSGQLETARVGCIDKPEGSRLMQPPEPGGARNWLRMAPVARERGNVVQITRRWMLSGRAGWNRDIYTEKGVNNS